MRPVDERARVGGGAVVEPGDVLVGTHQDEV